VRRLMRKSSSASSWVIRLADHFFSRRQVSIRPRNGPLSTLRNSRDASGPALLLIQAEIGAVVRGVEAGEFDYPT